MNSMPFIVMGFTSMLLQIMVLRLLLSTFSGNELDIGITLSFWLIYVGIGSFTGRRVKFKYAFPLSFILIALLAQPTAFAIKAIRPVLSLVPGEAVSFASTILSTAICIFPLCFTVGIQFPLAVSHSVDAGAAGRVYGLEAVGACIGGVLFTFFISSRIGVMELCLSLALINILTAFYLSRKKVLGFLFVIPLFMHLGLSPIALGLPWHGLELSKVVESKYGEIAAIKVRNQTSIYANGHLFFSYPDIQTEEFRTHLTMSLHPVPLKVLVIGGSPGTLREFLKYPLADIHFVELDPKIVEVALELLKGADRFIEKNNRGSIIIQDGRRFIKGLTKPAYDIILMNLPQPSTASINRYYTSDFFKEIKRVLKDNGILSLTIAPSTGYIGRSMQTASGSVYNSLRSVFKYVEVTDQDYGGVFASESAIDIDAETLEQRFMQRAIETKHFNRYIFREVFSPFGMDYVKKRLGSVQLVNTDLSPSAYLYNLMLWSEIHGGKALRYLLKIRGWHVISISAILLLFVSVLIFRKKKRIIYYSIFTTGFSGMTFVLSIILAYQALFGYVYEMIGVLSAAFMIGLWIGTVLTRHSPKALQTLLSLEIITAILALTAPVFFKAEILFYILILVSGTITGGQFSTANLSIGEPEAAGRLYGLDLIGSFLGAFIPSIILIPLFGVADTLLVIAAVKAVSAAMISTLRAGK